MADVKPMDAPVTHEHMAKAFQGLNQAMAAALAALDAKIEDRFLNLSERLAIKEYGIETVAAAAKAAGDKIGTFIDAKHPYDELVQAFKDGKLK